MKCPFQFNFKWFRMKNKSNNFIEWAIRTLKLLEPEYIYEPIFNIIMTGNHTRLFLFQVQFGYILNVHANIEDIIKFVNNNMSNINCSASKAINYMYNNISHVEKCLTCSGLLASLIRRKLFLI